MTPTTAVVFNRVRSSALAAAPLLVLGAPGIVVVGWMSSIRS
jgi:hypothetical protein